MEFLKVKWSYWFTTLDINNDGMVTIKDVKKTLQDFPKVEGLSKVEGQKAVEKIEKWWNEYILKGRTEVTKDEFLKDFEEDYKRNKSMFVTRISQLCQDLIEVVDADHTKEISLDNFVKSYTVCGHDNEALLRKAFELYKPSHGMVPIKEIVDDWVLFLTNTDPKKKDVVFDTYSSGLI